MTGPRRKCAVAALLVAAAFGLSGCPRPDANAPVRPTGDRTAAVPETTTSTTTTTAGPTTTYYYGPDGPGGEG